MESVSDIKLQVFSNQYYEFVEKLVKNDFEDSKVLGKFYTDTTVAGRMVEELLSKFKCRKEIIRIIDPFCGDGRLVAVLLSHINLHEEYRDKDIQVVLWDIDQVAVEVARDNLDKIKNSLSLNVVIEAAKTDAFVDYASAEDTFDICVTNPPWGILKPQKIFNARCSTEEIDEYKKSIALYDEYIRSEFPLSQPTRKFGKWGTNLGRTGTEVALRLISSDGICGLVSPASLLNDQVSVPLRKWVFEEYKLHSICYYPAELKLYGTADVSSITVVITKGKTTSGIKISRYCLGETHIEETIEESAFDYIVRNNYSIPIESGLERLAVLQKIEASPTVLSYCENQNLFFTRELDETKVSEKLKETGAIRFAKGYMVDQYSFTPCELYLDEEEFAPPSTVHCWKLVWRDVSRNSQKRRMKATLLPPKHIAGNSLGVITTNDNNSIPALKALLAVMNSMVFEIQARSQLVSNHVSAGIIKHLRIPNKIDVPALVAIVDKQLAGEDLQWDIECIVAKMYGLSEKEFVSIIEMFQLDDDDQNTLKARVADVYGRKKEMIPNHYAAKLSELDMQVVHCVPPGGNWKDIPESIPSRRLEQIRESYNAGKGSRSTYYGRLLPDMPAYTINTYFNRPGNGCNMHYSQDRTLSQREAARLQTFPDSFEFKGSLGAINNQIGNAVPVLLAYQIAKAIPFKGQFVDLFSGAGGLALGFIWAGWKPIIANDIDKFAIETHKANIGEEAICGDINSEEVYNTIVSAAMRAKEEHPELPLFVLGGPPCQGFSTANTRRGADDMRNWLFKAYVKIVKAIQPNGFVFENVKGITNLDGSRFFEMIKGELETCIEKIKVNRVNAADFGIPQRRERVIIIGGAEKFVDSFSLIPKTAVLKNGQLGLLPQVVGVEDALEDLPPIKHAEDGSNLGYLHEAKTPFQKFIRGIITPDEYLDSYK